jgi:hypothetical protein
MAELQQLRGLVKKKRKVDAMKMGGVVAAAQQHGVTKEEADMRSHR